MSHVGSVVSLEQKDFLCAAGQMAERERTQKRYTALVAERETTELRQREALDRVERYLGVANTEMNVHDLIHVISKGNAQEGLVLCDLIEVVKMVKQL